MTRVEYNVKEAAKTGDKYWPPSYPAFIGYCEKPHGSQAHRNFTTPLIGETAEQKQKRKQAGADHASKILEMLNDG